MKAASNGTDGIIINRTTRKQKWEEKQFYWYFKRQPREISHEKTWTWLRKYTESILIAVQNYAIRTSYIKTKIDKTQQSCKCRLCDDRDETMNLIIISECSKLAQKQCKTRYDWVVEVIHWELCKEFKFDHTARWFMHN